MPPNSPHDLASDPAPSSQTQHERASAFLRRHHARALPAAPSATDDARAHGTEPALAGSQRALAWDAERILSDWRALDVNGSDAAFCWRGLPLRCAASCDEGREVATVRGIAGQEVPLRVSQVGALSALHDGGTARETWSQQEKVVALCADRFGWHEIEEWSALLASRGFGLLIASGATVPLARERTREESLRLERQGLRECAHEESLAVLGGPLALRRGALAPARPAVALCPLPDAQALLPPLITPEWQPEPPQPEPAAPEGKVWVPDAVRQTIHELRPGQRTPAWRCDEVACPLACWFLRVEPARPGAPLSGLARIEVRREAWESQADAGAFASALSLRLLESHLSQPQAAAALRQRLVPREEVEAAFARLCGL